MIDRDDLSNNNLPNILANIHLSYQKLMVDMMVLLNVLRGKTNTSNNSNNPQEIEKNRKIDFLTKFAEMYIDFLKTLEMNNHDKFIFQQNIFQTNLAIYKKLVKNSPVMRQVAARVEQDVKNNAQMLREYLFENGVNVVPQFLTEMQTIKSINSVPERVNIFFETGSQKDIGLKKSKREIATKALQQTLMHDQYLTSDEKFNTLNRMVKNTFDIGQALLEDKQYSQAIVKYSEMIDYLKNFGESNFRDQFSPKLKNLKNERLENYQNLLKAAQINYIYALDVYCRYLREEHNDDEILQTFELQLSLLMDITAPDDKVLLIKIAQIHEGLAGLKKNNYEEASAHYKAALEIYEKPEIKSVLPSHTIPTIKKEFAELSCHASLAQGSKYTLEKNYKAALESFGQAAQHIDTLKELINHNEETRVLALEAALFMNLADHYLDQIDDISELERKKFVYGSIIDYLKKVLNNYPTSIENLNTVKDKLAVAYVGRGNVLSLLKDYAGAINDCRNALALANEISISESIIENITAQLVAIEAAFINNYLNADEEPESSSEDESDSESDFESNTSIDVPNDFDMSVETNKRKSELVIDKKSSKRQKREVQNQELFDDILQRYDEILKIVEEIDTDILVDFVKAFKINQHYVNLHEKFVSARTEMSETEIIAYCLPILFSDIQKIDLEHLKNLITTFENKVPPILINDLRLIDLALQYESSLKSHNENERNNIQQAISNVLMIIRVQVQTKEQIDDIYQKINLKNAVLGGISLPKHVFNLALLDDIDFNNATLSECQFLNASLHNAQLMGAVLDGAQFVDADMEDANFIGANLRSANLSFANCTGCDFSKADLSNAILYETDLSRTNLDKTILSGAKFLNPAQCTTENAFILLVTQFINSYHNHRQKAQLFNAVIDEIIIIIDKMEPSNILNCIDQVQNLFLANDNTNDNITSNNTTSISTSNFGMFESNNNNTEKVSDYLEKLTAFRNTKLAKDDVIKSTHT